MFLVVYSLVNVFMTEKACNAFDSLICNVRLIKHPIKSATLPDNIDLEHEILHKPSLNIVK